VVLILTLLGTTGVSYQLFGQPQAVLRNSLGGAVRHMVCYPQEIASVGWLATHVEQNAVVSSDQYGSTRIATGELLEPSAQPLKFFSLSNWNMTGGYLYLTYENEVDHTAIMSWNATPTRRSYTLPCPQV
jgi:uncharacterized membrane protein